MKEKGVGMMPEVYIVRRGHNDTHMGEHSIGKKEMRAVAEFFKALPLQNSSTAILSANSLRAEPSAMTLCQELRIPKMESVVWLGDCEVQPYRALKGYIEEHAGIRHVILVSHIVQIEDILECAQKEFSRSTFRKRHTEDVQPGSVYRIDFRARHIGKVFSPPA